MGIITVRETSTRHGINANKREIWRTTHRVRRS